MWLPYLLSDICAITAAYYTTFFVRIHLAAGDTFYTRMRGAIGLSELEFPSPDFHHFYQDSALRIIMLLAVTICGLYAFSDGYAGLRLIRNKLSSFKVTRANLIALLIYFGYFYLTANRYHPRSYFLSCCFFAILYTLVFRQLTDHLLRALRNAGILAYIRTLVLFDRMPGEDLRELLRANGMDPVFSLPMSETDEDLDILALAVSHNADMLIILAPGSGTDDVMPIVRNATSAGLDVKVLSDALQSLPAQARLTVDMFEQSPLVHFSARRERKLTAIATRTMSLLTALLIAVLSAPLLLILVVLIRITSQGSSIFRQRRIGLHGNPFTIYKLRTMRADSEAEREQFDSLNDAGDGLFKMKKDPRITPLGRFMRRFSFDEIPQVRNVFDGDMAIVGPRPLPQTDLSQHTNTWQDYRHSVAPGLTCLWQVSGRSDLDFETMCVLDIYYICNRSVVLDLRIMLRTVGVILFGKGAY